MNVSDGDPNTDEDSDTNNGTYSHTLNVKDFVNILGLNCCGLRSKLKNGLFDDEVSNYDIICLSETKVDYIDLTKTALEGEFSYFIKEKSILYPKHQNGGVHGLCMLIRKNIAAHSQLLRKLSHRTSFGLNLIKMPLV